MNAWKRDRVNRCTIYHASLFFDQTFPTTCSSNLQLSRQTECLRGLGRITRRNKRNIHSFNYLDNPFHPEDNQLSSSAIIVSTFDAEINSTSELLRVISTWTGALCRINHVRLVSPIGNWEPVCSPRDFNTLAGASRKISQECENCGKLACREESRKDAEWKLKEEGVGNLQGSNESRGI